MNLIERMEFYKASGASLAVIINGKLTSIESYGYIDFYSHQKVNSKTLFQAGSISKTINAVGILMLTGQYKLSLDQDVNKYLKSYLVEDNQFTKNHKVTLRQLLSHSAGTNVHGFPGYNRTQKLPSTLEILLGQKPKVNTDKIEVVGIPGKKCVYSGGGTTITQMIIEDITGELYQNWMDKNVLANFGMIHSTYDQLQINGKTNMAAGHLQNGEEVAGRYHLYPEMAAAGLTTTAEDLGNFLIKIFELLDDECEQRVLELNLLKEMISPQIQGFDNNFAGLGVFINNAGDGLRFEHDGMNEGFVARFVAYPASKSGFVIMINNENAVKLLDEIAANIEDIYDFQVLSR